MLRAGAMASPRADRDPARQAAGDGHDPGRGGAGAARARPVARARDRVPALRRRDGGHGHARDADRRAARPAAAACPSAMAFGTTIAAQLGVTPLLLFHFHEVPGVTIAANLAAFPAVSPALLLGIAASALGLVWLPLGHAVSFVARDPDALPGGRRIDAREGAGRVDHLRRRAVGAHRRGVRRSSRSRPGCAAGGGHRAALVVVAIALAPLVVWQAALGAGPPRGLTVRMLDIGQGDSILITSPGGATVLIDGGPDEELAAQLLVSYGVKRLDAVVATHPHADHIAGLPQILARFPVGVFLEPGCPDATELQADAARGDRGAGHPRARRRAPATSCSSVTCRSACCRRIGAGTARIPIRTTTRSCCCSMTGGDSMLFTGDSERRGAAGAARHGRAHRRRRAEDAAPRRRHVVAGAVPGGGAGGDRDQRRATESVRTSRTQRRWPRRRRPAPRSGGPTSTARSRSRGTNRATRSSAVNGSPSVGNRIS